MNYASVVIPSTARATAEKLLVHGTEWFFTFQDQMGHQNLNGVYGKGL